MGSKKTKTTSSKPTARAKASRPGGTKLARRAKARRARRGPDGDGLLSVHVRVPARIAERIRATGIAAFRKINAQVAYLLETHPEIRDPAPAPTAAEGPTPTAAVPAPSMRPGEGAPSIASTGTETVLSPPA